MDEMEQLKATKICCEACGYEIGVRPYQVKNDCVLACDDCSYIKPAELIEKVKERRSDSARKKYKDYEKCNYRHMEKLNG